MKWTSGWMDGARSHTLLLLILPYATLTLNNTCCSQSDDNMRKTVKKKRKPEVKGFFPYPHNDDSFVPQGNHQTGWRTVRTQFALSFYFIPCTTFHNNKKSNNLIIPLGVSRLSPLPFRIPFFRANAPDYVISSCSASQHNRRNRDFRTEQTFGRKMSHYNNHSIIGDWIEARPPHFGMDFRER